MKNAPETQRMIDAREQKRQEKAAADQEQHDFHQFVLQHKELSCSSDLRNQKRKADIDQD